MRNSLILLTLFVLLAATAFGQMTSISGTVMDPSGSVIPNAAVTLTNTDTGAERTATSDSQGRYVIAQVTPGTYSLTAKASGFADLSIHGVVLEVNQPATQAIKFEKVGSTSTTVSVEASAVQLNTVDASLGNVINSSAIIELPSFARNVANLLSFQPGVAFFGGSDDRNASAHGRRTSPHPNPPGAPR